MQPKPQGDEQSTCNCETRHMTNVVGSLRPTFVVDQDSADLHVPIPGRVVERRPAQLTRKREKSTQIFTLYTLKFRGR